MDQSNQICMGYQICDAAVINIADELLRDEMQIFIKTIDDKILTFEMKHSNKIRDVKMKIEEKTKLSANQQNLFYQGEILNDDDKTIDEYQICEKSVIDIISRLRGGMKIFGKTRKGKILEFKVQKSERIIDVKRQIEKETGVHIDYQKLIYQGGILEDDKTIDEHEILEKSMIQILDSREMKILGKTLDGKMFSIFVLKSDRISDVKKMFQNKMGMNRDEQELINQCLKLKDNKTIDEYQICENSVINIVARLKAGMYLLEAEKSNKISDIIMKQIRLQKIENN